MTRVGGIYHVSTVTLRTSRIQANHPPHPQPWTKPTRSAPPNGLKAATGLVYITYVCVQYTLYMYAYNIHCVYCILCILLLCPPHGLKPATSLVYITYVCVQCVYISFVVCCVFYYYVRQTVSRRQLVWWVLHMYVCIVCISCMFMCVYGVY